MSEPISRRIFMKNAALVALMAAGVGTVGALSSCGTQSPSSASLDPAGSAARYQNSAVKVYHWSSPGEAALFVAQERGYFQKYGITAEMVKVSGDLSTLKTEKKACIFQVMPHQFSQLLDKTDQNVDAKVLSSVHTGGLRAVCTAASGISAVSDLPGKRVAVVSSSNDPGQIALQAAMAGEGIHRDVVEWIPEGSFDVALEELVAENVDACACTDLSAQIASTFFGMNTFYDTATDPALEGVAYSYLAGNGLVYADDELACRVATAVDEAGRWIEANPIDAAALIQSTGYVTANKQLLVSYGITVESGTPDVYELVLAGYDFGDGGGAAFDRSLRLSCEGLLKAGVSPSGKTAEELCSSLGYYAL